ncbi:hypothetical protein MTO96_045012, partial [Rhipicephalus appendiculatus]
AWPPRFPCPKSYNTGSTPFLGGHVIYVAVAVAVVVSICGAALIVASNTGRQKPVCDEACMQYTTIWRPITSVFFYPMGFHYLVNLYFLYTCSIRLETGIATSPTALAVLAALDRLRHRGERPTPTTNDPNAGGGWHNWGRGQVLGN